MNDGQICSPHKEPVLVTFDRLFIWLNVISLMVAFLISPYPYCSFWKLAHLHKRLYLLSLRHSLNLPRIVVVSKLEASQSPKRDELLTCRDALHPQRFEWWPQPRPPWGLFEKGGTWQGFVRWASFWYHGWLRSMRELNKDCFAIFESIYSLKMKGLFRLLKWTLWDEQQCKVEWQNQVKFRFVLINWILNFLWNAKFYTWTWLTR